jgi:transposase
MRNGDDLDARIARLDADLAALHRQRRDEVAFVHLLAAVTGGRIFSAADLVAHAAVDPALREVLGPTPSPRTVGRRLSRLANRSLDGFILRRVDRDEDGCMWTVALTS